MSSTATEPKKKGGKVGPEEELKFAIAVFRQMLEGGTLPTLDFKVIAAEIDPTGAMTANACGIRWLRFRERNGLPAAAKKAKEGDDAKAVTTPKKRAAPKKEGDSAKKVKSTPTPKKKGGAGNKGASQEGQGEVEGERAGDIVNEEEGFAVRPRDAGQTGAEEAEEMKEGDEFYEA